MLKILLLVIDNQLMYVIDMHAINVIYCQNILAASIHNVSRIATELVWVYRICKAHSMPRLIEHKYYGLIFLLVLTALAFRPNNPFPIWYK